MDETSEPGDGGSSKYVVVEACAGFINDLTAQQRKCGHVKMQALDVEIALHELGVDKEALTAELQALHEEIESMCMRQGGSHWRSRER